MWRPKGWGNPMPCGECSKVSRGNNCATSCHQYIRYSSKESGADAMLEGLADLDGWVQFERKDGKVIAVYIDD